MTKDALDPNPFAKALLAKEGNATAREIYTSVGFALDRWEHCEVSFATIYSALVKPVGSNHILMRAFGVVTASNARREMILEACDAYFAYRKNDKLKAETRHLLNLYKDAAARRNEIAHATVMGQTSHTIVENVAVPLPTKWFLVPPIFATRKNQLLSDISEPFAGLPKFRYSTREIDHFSSCFDELGSRASKMMQAIRAFYETLPEKHD